MPEGKLSKKLKSAIDNYKSLLIKQQELKKKFVSSTKEKKDQMKKELVDLHKKVKYAEEEMESLLKYEEEEYYELIDHRIKKLKNVLKEDFKKHFIKNKVFNEVKQFLFEVNNIFEGSEKK